VRGQGLQIKMSSARMGDTTTKEKVWSNGMPSTLRTEGNEVTKKLNMERIGARSGKNDNAVKSAVADEGRTVAQEHNIK
jgi:hypothetical protein